MCDADTLTAIRRINTKLRALALRSNIDLSNLPVVPVHQNQSQSQKVKRQTTEKAEKAEKEARELLQAAAIEQEKKKRKGLFGGPAGGLLGGITSGFKLKSKAPPVQSKIQLNGSEGPKIMNDWVQPKFKRMIGKNVELRILDREASLLPLLDWIAEEKVANPGLTNDDILIAFDMDGTLKHVVNADNIKNGDSLRGAGDSRTFFRAVKDMQIKWIVISAKAGVKYMKNSTAKNLFETLKFTEDDIGGLSTHCSSPNPISKSMDYTPVEGYYEKNGKKYKTVRCNNLFNGYDANEGDDEPIGNEKDMVLEYAITQICQEYPKLIIFVDDNAENVMTVYNHYKSTPIRVISALYPPFTKEETHDMGYASMKQQMGKFQGTPPQKKRWNFDVD